MMFPLRLFLILLFSLSLLPINFPAGIVPKASAAMLSCLPVVSVMQEKVRIFLGSKGTHVPATASTGDFSHPVAAKDSKTKEELTDKSGNKVFRVGCLLPLSGPYADYGQRFLQGMEMALEVYTGKESYSTKKIKLLVRDTQGLKDAVTPLVHELVDVEQVAILIGPVVGQVSQGAAKEALALHVPIITLTSQPGIASMGGMVFQHFITARNQAEELVKFMVGKLNGRQPVILYPDTLFGRIFSDSYAALASRLGWSAIKKVRYQSTATDFGLVINDIIGGQIKSAGNNSLLKSGKRHHVPKNRMALVIPGSCYRLKLLAPQLVHYGMENVLIFGSRGWHDFVCNETLPYGLSKVFFVDAFSASVEGMPALLVHYRQRYEQQFKKKPSLYDAYGYDTIMLIKQVVGRLSNWPVGGEQLAAAIHTLPEMEMVTGITNIRPDGEIEKRLYRFMAEKDRVTIYPRTPPLSGQ